MFSSGRQTLAPEAQAETLPGRDPAVQRPWGRGRDHAVEAETLWRRDPAAEADTLVAEEQARRAVPPLHGRAGAHHNQPSSLGL